MFIALTPSLFSLFSNAYKTIAYLISQEGINYHYVDRESMLEAIGRGEFIEHAEFSGNPFNDVT